MPYPWRAFLGLLISVACTVDGDNGATSLGDPTVSTSATTTVGTTVGTTATSSSEESGDPSSSGEEAESEGGSTAPDPMESSEGEAGSSGGGTDEQPDAGVYAECESSIDCVGAQYCITVMPNVGFCSKNCVDPTVDCPASPGGTADSACVAAMPIGAPAMVCALDCSGGATCPGGMECAQLDAAMVCV